MKGIQTSIAFLGVCLLISVWVLSNALSSNNFPNSINVNQSISEEYELIVNDGWLYLYNKTNGQVWKKQDDAGSSWETVKHFTGF